jgi:MFS family permease
VSPTFHSLRIRNYRLYATGAVISNVGTWMQRVAQDWLVLQLSHHSGVALGITTGLQFLPMLLLGPWGGTLADRYSKRTLLMMTQAFMGGVAAVLGLLDITGLVQVWEVYLLALLLGVGTALDNPTRQSFVVEMVGRDQLANAVGLNSASFNLGRIVGPALAGVLIAALGSGVRATGWVILLNAVSYLAVIGSLQAMHAAELSPSNPLARGEGKVRDGVRYVLASPDLVFVFVVAFAAGTFGMNFQITNALMATAEFHKGAGEYGLLGTCMAVGSLTGALLAARRAGTRRLLVVLAALAFGVSEFLAALSPSYLVYALWLPVVGISSMTLLNAMQTTVQMSVAPEFRGRVMALYMMILMGGTPVGAPVIGWVGQTFGPRWTLLGGAAVTLVVVVAATGWLMRTEDIQLRDVSVHDARISA